MRGINGQIYRKENEREKEIEIVSGFCALFGCSINKIVVRVRVAMFVLHTE